MGQSWEQGQSIIIEVSSIHADEIVLAIAEGLLPQITYALRLVVVDKVGNKEMPGPEIVIDTDSISCTPKPRYSCMCLVS
jgi:hypothetical protein